MKAVCLGVACLGCWLDNWGYAGEGTRGVSSLSAELPIGGDKCYVTVPVNIAGRSYRFVVDTGSSLTTYDARLRSLLGTLNEFRSVKAVGGRTRMELCAAPRLLLGNLELPAGIKVLCHDLRPIAAVSGCDIYGIIGLDILSHYIVSFDFDANKLLLSDTLPVVVGGPVPIERKNGAYYVKAKLCGFVTEDFLIDTGCGAGGETCGALSSETYDLLLEMHKLSPRLPGISFGEKGMFVCSRGILDVLEMADHKVEHVEFERNSTFSVSELGLNIWRRFHVIFDFPGQRLYLRPRERHKHAEGRGSHR